MTGMIDLRSIQIGTNPAGNRPVFLRQHSVRLMKVLARPVISLRQDISYNTPFVKLLVTNQVVNASTGELSTAKFKAAFGQESFVRRFSDAISTRFRFPDREEMMKACLGRLMPAHGDNFMDALSPSRSLPPGFLPMEDPNTAAGQKEKPSDPIVEKKVPTPKAPAVAPKLPKSRKSPPPRTSPATPKAPCPATVQERKKPPITNEPTVKEPTKQPRKSISGMKGLPSRKPVFTAETVSLVFTLPYDVLSIPPELAASLPNTIKGRRIAKIRESRGLTKGELAKEAEIKTSTYAYVETRDALPNPHQLFSISRALRVAPELIICGLPFENAIADLSEGEKIVFLRLRHGWTQNDLAEEMGNIVTRSAINYWEQNKSFPEGDILVSLRQALGYRDILLNSRHFYPGRASEEPRLAQTANRMRKARTMINPGTLSALSGLSITTARNFLKNHPEYGYVTGK